MRLTGEEVTGIADIIPEEDTIDEDWFESEFRDQPSK
jgi:hypothetical protein